MARLGADQSRKIVIRQFCWEDHLPSWEEIGAGRVIERGNIAVAVSRIGPRASNLLGSGFLDGSKIRTLFLSFAVHDTFSIFKLFFLCSLR